MVTSVATPTESVKSKKNSKWDCQREFVDGGVFPVSEKPDACMSQGWDWNE